MHLLCCYRQHSAVGCRNCYTTAPIFYRLRSGLDSGSNDLNAAQHFVEKTLLIQGFSFLRHANGHKFLIFSYDLPVKNTNTTEYAIIWNISLTHYREKRSDMKEFFGIDGYQRPVEGYLSWQHLLFVTALMVIMVACAVLLGKRNKGADIKTKNRVLIWAAFLIDGFELFKIFILCYKDQSWSPILHNLPLFLCSIQLLAIPLAAFSRGMIKEACLDFVCIFGIAGAILGVYGAGQNYNAYPVLSFDNVVSGITHSISGFASLYIMISGMTGLKRKNIFPTTAILLGFCVIAYVANILVDYNYMFLMQGDGTPYDILYNLVGGNPVFYPMGVVALFFIYLFSFYYIHFLVSKRKQAAPAVSA